MPTRQFAMKGNDERETWKWENSFMGRARQATIKEVTDKSFPKEETQSLCELFNETLIHATDKLRIVHGTNRLEYKPILSCAETAHLAEITEAELWNIIGRMKKFTPPGFDKIPVPDLYYNYNILKGVILKVLDRILETGIIPKELKIPIVRSVYQSGKKTDCANYKRFLLYLP